MALQILTKFFVLYDAFLDASLFTVRAFLIMIRERMAVRARPFSPSETTDNIWCPVIITCRKATDKLSDAILAGKPPCPGARV